MVVEFIRDIHDFEFIVCLKCDAKIRERNLCPTWDEMPIH